MSRVCQLTGKTVVIGNNVSHANNKSSREFAPNLQTKTFFIPEEGRSVKLKLSTKAIKTIAKHGISAVLKDARKKGFKV